MRLAMLTESKYVALVNNYSDVGRTLKRLEDQTSVDIFDFALKYEIARLSGKRGKERLEHLQRLKIPPALKVYGFDNGQVTKFDSPEANEWRLLGLLFLEFLVRGIGVCGLWTCSLEGGRVVVFAIRQENELWQKEVI